ncbi:MAG: hypothetical protein Q9183_002417, partial [Haloplaca sp. 2 TL-2023]
MSNWVRNASPELNQQSQWPMIIGVAIVLLLISTAVVLMRGYTRHRILRSLGADDYVIFATQVCSIIYGGLCIGQTRYGLGLPISLRPEENLDPYSVINFAGRPFYMAGILGFKVALCIGYLRIIQTSSHPKYKTTIYATGLSAIAGHLAGTLVLIFQCSPVHKSWLPETPGTCLPNDATFFALAAITIFFDVVIFVLPIPLLLKLKIGFKKKAGLVVVFLLGLLTTVCSIMRMVQITTIAETGNSTMLVLWGVIELNVGIILTCLPVLGPLFPKITGLASSVTDPSGNNYQMHNYSKPVKPAKPAKGKKKQPTISNPVYASGPKRTDLGGTTVNASDSSQEEILGLKDADAAFYGVRADEEASKPDDMPILKTTNINVEYEDSSDRATSRAMS